MAQLTIVTIICIFETIEYNNNVLLASLDYRIISRNKLLIGTKELQSLNLDVDRLMTFQTDSLNA
jgi:hypothetical protein